jgi:predicted dehydrogenase
LKAAPVFSEMSPNGDGNKEMSPNGDGNKDAVERRTFNFGIVGGGCIGREHISNIKLLQNAAVRAVADTAEMSRKSCRELLDKLNMESTEVLEDYQELLKMPDIDAVLVATPNNHHIHVIRDAYKIGVKGLLVEKPLCTTMDDCLEVLSLVDQHPDITFWVGMEYRYIPSIDRLIDKVHNGAIGSPKMLSIREHRFPFLQKVDNWNRFTANTGGTLVEKCCHFFDLMLHIMKAKPVRILASGSQDVNHKDEVYNGKTSDILDNAYVVIEFDGGQRACMDICMFAEASRHQEEISLVGDGGKIEAFAPAHGAAEDDETLPNFVIGQKGVKEVKTGYDPPAPIKPSVEHIKIDETLMEAGHHCGATYYELDNFVWVCSRSQPAHVNAIDGMLAVALGLAAHTAIDEKRIVHFSEFGVDKYWELRHRPSSTDQKQTEMPMGKTASGLQMSKAPSGRRVQDLQQQWPLSQDGERSSQMDGWEICMRSSPSKEALKLESD